MSLSTDADFFSLLANSYSRLLGQPLVPAGMNATEGAAWLYEAAPSASLRIMDRPILCWSTATSARRRFLELTGTN